MLPIIYTIFFGIITFYITCYFTYKEDEENPENSGPNYFLAFILSSVVMILIYIFLKLIAVQLNNQNKKLINRVNTTELLLTNEKILNDPKTCNNLLKNASNLNEQIMKNLNTLELLS